MKILFHLQIIFIQTTIFAIEELGSFVFLFFKVVLVGEAFIRLRDPFEG